MKLLLLNFLVILTVVYAQKRSLTFVLDVSKSFENKLPIFKKGAKMTLDNIDVPDPDIVSYFDDFLLITFDDADADQVFVSGNKTEFKSKIDKVKIAKNNNSDDECRKTSYNALKIALEASLPNSYIFLITDSSPNDEYLDSEIISLANARKSHVVFLLADGCAKANFTDYNEITDNTDAKVYHWTESTNLYQMMKHSRKRNQKEAYIVAKIKAELIKNSTVNDLVLRCLSTGISKSSVRWLKDNKEMLVDTRIQTDDDSLVIHNMNQSDNGTYSCIVENNLTNLSASLTLNVESDGLIIPKNCKDHFLVKKICNESVVNRGKCNLTYPKKFCCHSCMKAEKLNLNEIINSLD